MDGQYFKFLDLIFGVLWDSRLYFTTYGMLIGATNYKGEMELTSFSGRWEGEDGESDLIN
jgi:hypothetical protein